MSSVKSQIVNILDFVSQEVKSRILSRFLHNEETNFYISIDEIQNIIKTIQFFCNIDILYLDSILLHWGSKLVFPNIISIANIHL